MRRYQGDTKASKAQRSWKAQDSHGDKGCSQVSKGEFRLKEN